MKTLISTIAIIIALTGAINAQSNSDNQKPKSNSGRFSFSEHLNNRPSQNKTSRDEAKTKMINTGQISIKHFADTLITWSYDEYVGDFVISSRKYYVYENGNAVEVITEVPSETGYTLSGRESFTYNDQNLMSENVLYFYDSDASSWQPYQKLEFLYNNDGVQIKEIHSEWCSDTNEWEIYFKFKEEFIYDSNNNLIAIEAYYWSLITGLDQYLPSYKEEFEYDELGRTSYAIFSIPNGLEFELSLMEEYHYDGDNIMPEYVFVHNMYDGVWTAEYKFADISWYKFEEDLIESMTIYTNEEWDDDWKSDSEWYEWLRFSFQYHPANDMRILRMEESFFWDEWQPVYREIIELNENLYITRYEEQYHWDAWETDYGFDYKWKFNENDEPVELTVMLYDSWDGDFWQYYKHYSFGYYTEPETVGISNPALDNTFSIYPNPAKDILHIYAVSSDNYTEVAIYDISGKLVKTHGFSGNIGNSTINISDLRQGLYFVKISNHKDAQIFKIIKQ